MKIRLIDILFVCVTLLTQLSTSEIIETGNLAYLVYFCVLLIMIIKYKVTLCSKSVFLTFFFTNILAPIVFLTILRVNMFNSVLTLLLSMVTFTMILFVTYKIDFSFFSKMIIALLIGNSIVLCFNIFINLSDISLFNWIYLLSGERAIRTTLGFSHPNWLGMYSSLEIILLYFNYKIYNRRIIIFITLGIISFIAIISSGSRTAFMSTIIFMTLNIFMFVIRKVNKTKWIYVVYIIPLIYIISYLSSTELTDGISELSSGRNYLNIDVWRYLVNNGYYLFGFSPINFTNLVNYIPVTDCWYLIYIAQYGIVGLIGWFIIFAILVSKFVKNNNFLGLNLLVYILCYGAMENVVFNPGVSLSVVIMLLLFAMQNNSIFYTINIKNKMEGNNSV